MDLSHYLIDGHLDYSYSCGKVSEIRWGEQNGFINSHRKENE